MWLRMTKKGNVCGVLVEKPLLKKSLKDLVVDERIIQGVGHFLFDREVPGPRCTKGVLYTASRRV